MPTVITPHNGCSVPGRLGALTGGVAAPNGGTSAPNGGTSASNNLALPAAVNPLLASNIEMGNRRLSP